MRRLAVGLLAFTLVSAGPVAPGEVDIFKRPVPAGEHRPTIVVYANKQTQDAVSDPLADFAVRMNDVRPLIIVRIDLRGLPGFLHGIAFENMRSRFVDGLKRYWTESQQVGEVPHQQPENDLFFISEPDGQDFQALGLAEGFHEAVAVVFDAQGNAIGSGGFPRESPRLEQLMRSSIHTE